MSSAGDATRDGTASGKPRTASGKPRFPAYGPVDAALGFGLFYVVVDRATPTVVGEVTVAVAGVSPGAVQFGLAAFLWFVFAVTLVDQARRQLVALGVLRSDGRRAWWPAPAGLSGARAAGYLAVVVVAGVVAAWTFDTAVETAVALIPVVAALDAAAFPWGDFAVLVGFAVAFGIASHALDRLVVGGVRTLLAGGRDAAE